MNDSTTGVDDVDSGEDLQTIGVTEQGAEALDALLRRGWFSTEMAAFKAAVAYAVANDIPPTSEGRFKTTWNTGSLDKNGEFIDTLVLLLGPQRPWDQVRRLGDAGLRHLAARLDSADVPTELFLGNAR